MKKSVKTIIVLFAVMALLAASIVLSASAASPSLKLRAETNSSGQTEVILSVSKGADLATIQAAVKYDSSKVKFVSVEYLSGDKNVSNTNTDGVVLINDIWLESVNDEADIVKVVFAAPSDTEATFTVEDIKATDSNDRIIDFAAPKAVKVSMKASSPNPDASNSSNSSSSSSTGFDNNSNIAGGTNGTSPNTGKLIASAAGVGLAAAAAAGVVIFLKKKNKREE